MEAGQTMAAEERAKGEAAAAKLVEELEATRSQLRAAMQEGGSLAAAKVGRALFTTFFCSQNTN